MEGAEDVLIAEVTHPRRRVAKGGRHKVRGLISVVAKRQERKDGREVREMGKFN